MRQIVGTYIAIIFMELVVAIPSYYLLRVMLRKSSVELMALLVCFVALAVGWTAGYRYTKDVMVSNYLTEVRENKFATAGESLQQSEWLALRGEFTSSNESVMAFNIGAAKLSLPSTLVVAILLFWLAERHKKEIAKLDLWLRHLQSSGQKVV